MSIEPTPLSPLEQKCMAEALSLLERLPPPINTGELLSLVHTAVMAGATLGMDRAIVSLRSLRPAEEPDERFHPGEASAP